MIYSTKLIKDYQCCTNLLKCADVTGPTHC